MAKETLREAENNVVLEGTVSEVRIETKKNNDGKEYITGEVDIQVDAGSIHTVRVFANKMNKEGNESGLYKGYLTIKNEYKSIATHGEESADRVRITQGKIGLNEYVGQDGQIKSFPQLSANFINRLNATDEFKPRAQFTLEMMVVGVAEEKNRSGEETGRAIIKGYVPVYGEKVIPFSVVVADPHAVGYVTNNYEKNSTVTVHGDIINRKIITTKEIEVGFGQPQQVTEQTTIREYLVIGGSEPKDEDAEKSFSKAAIKKALGDREKFHAELKEKKKNQGQNQGNNKPSNNVDPFAADKDAKGFGKLVDIDDSDLPF